MHEVAAKLNTLQQELNQKFLEREDAIEASVLAVLSKEHVISYGPPGTGKSELSRDIAGAFTGASYYEVAMSKTRATEAVFGPIDIKEFRENGHMFRKGGGFLQTCNFAFIDEIGKMNPIIGHDMLAALNERIYHEVNGGRSVHDIPLHTVFAASNEELTSENGDENSALRDRILFNVVVDYLSDDNTFKKLLTISRADVGTVVDYKDVLDVAENHVPAVKHSTDAIKSVLALRKKLRKEHIYPSDRRWRASMRAMQAHAFLNGRTETFEEDLAALRFTLWDTAAQMEVVHKLTAGSANPFVEAVNEISEGLKEIGEQLAARADLSDAERADYAREAINKLGEQRKRLDGLLGEAKGRSIPKFKDASDLHKELIISVYETSFGIERDEAELAASKRLGLGDGTAPTPEPAAV